MSEHYKRKPNTQCAVCAKPIYRRPREIEQRGHRVYCSLTCFGVSCRKETPCVVCNKPMLSGLNKISCSRACANKNRTGIVYRINRPRDKVASVRALKLRLIETRGMRCERCGYAKLEILHVHHKNRNHNDNRIENLELICPNCHYEEHFSEKSWMKKQIK